MQHRSTVFDRVVVHSVLALTTVLAVGGGVRGALFSSVAHADANSNKNLPALRSAGWPNPQAARLAEELPHMDMESLFKLGEEFNQHARTAALRIMTRSAGVDADLSLIAALTAYPFEESLGVLFGILRSELKRADTEGIVAYNEEVARAALAAIADVATAKPSRVVDELEDLKEEARGRLGSEAFAALQSGFDSTLEAAKGRDEALINLNDYIEQKRAESSGGRTRMTRVRQMIERRLIGQPEVVEALMDLEWRSELYGQGRTNPDALYLMGMAGTGKDTAAETFTDALHGYEGAYQTHMFRMPTMKTQASIWQVLGSATGYIGSDKFPPFLAFLVEHSDGRYKLQETQNHRGEKTFMIVDNPEYQGKTLPGYFSPNTGVVFVNEFHNWSKQLKDDFIKQALEKGIFTVNNPNGGLAEIRVPIRFILASNEGIGLTSSREANGQRFGKALGYEQLLAKWEKIHDNKAALKSEILAGNGERNASARGEGTPGTSEELLSRIPDRFLLLMRPLAPSDLQKIARLGLETIARRMQSSRLLGQVTLTWTDRLVTFLQEYDYQPEENARHLKDRLGTIVEDPILDAVKEDRLKTEGGEMKINLDIADNDDRTRSLSMEVSDPSGREYPVLQPIRYTFRDRPKAPISNDRIDQLLNVEAEMKANVFGIDPILERLAQRVLSIENEANAGAERPANLVMLTGLTSTGKTETAKQLYRKVTGAKDELPTFDFSNIQTLHAFQQKILGSKDAAGNPIPSEFMKQYDRNNGRMVVAFDELANVRDGDLLKSLYDLFREPVVTTFSDGVARPMGGVVIIITGNAGQELYNQVPSHLPMEVQMEAWAEIYRETNQDTAQQRRVLEKYFPEPLITRIGRNNIFFVPPHSYKSLRQLAQLKFGQALDRLRSSENRRGWNVLFPTVDEYRGFIDTIVAEGFSLRYQGASIDSFVRDDFEEPIKYLLLKNKVQPGAKVFVKFKNKTDNSDKDKPGYVSYDLYAEGQSAPIEFKFQRPYVEKPLQSDDVDQIITAFHEAGHSVVRQAVFKDAYVQTAISVIPGVTMIGDEWIYYAGIARAEQEKKVSATRDTIVRQIAIFAGGETAERLVSRGETHSSGKKNDMERATDLARRAIVEWGLSRKWGTHSVPAGTSIEAYIAGLSEGQKRLLESETQAIVSEGRRMAQEVLEANFDSALVPLGLKLAENGILERERLKEFYGQVTLVDPADRGFIQRKMDSLRTKMRKWKSPRTNAVQVELDASITPPRKIADIREIAEKAKQAQYAEVELPQKLPVEAMVRAVSGAVGSGPGAKEKSVSGSPWIATALGSKSCASLLAL